MPAVQAQSTPGFRIVFPSGSASVSAFVKHWFLLPLPLGALVPWVAQKRLGHCQLDLRAPPCLLQAIVPPTASLGRRFLLPCRSGASGSHPHHAPRSLPPVRPSLPEALSHPLVQRPLRLSRVTSAFEGAIFPTRMDYRLQELLKASSCRLRLHFTSSAEHSLWACPLSLQYFSVLLPGVVVGKRPPRRPWKQ